MKIGCDISKVERFAKFDNNFLTKYFNATEIEYISLKPIQNKPQTIAGMFSAKEAFLKSVGTGMLNGIILQDIVILHDERGKPTIKYLGEIQAISTFNFDVSISHDDGIAMAVVVAW